MTKTYRSLKFYSPDEYSYSKKEENILARGHTTWEFRIFEDGAIEEICTGRDSAFENVQSFERELKKVYNEMGVTNPWLSPRRKVQA